VTEKLLLAAYSRLCGELTLGGKKYTRTNIPSFISSICWQLFLAHSQSPDKRFFHTVM
jgi:hypothetical protein